jgi:hypothetical protein
VPQNQTKTCHSRASGKPAPAGVESDAAPEERSYACRRRRFAVAPNQTKICHCRASAGLSGENAAPLICHAYRSNVSAFTRGRDSGIEHSQTRLGRAVVPAIHEHRLRRRRESRTARANEDFRPRITSIFQSRSNFARNHDGDRVHGGRDNSPAMTTFYNIRSQNAAFFPEALRLRGDDKGFRSFSGSSASSRACPRASWAGSAPNFTALTIGRSLRVLRG